MTTAREALAEIINDRHQGTRPWSDMVARTDWQRTNGDDYAIRTAYAAADAILSAFPGIRETIEGPVPPRKTIAQRIAFDAAVSNRAREVVEIRKLAAAAAAPEPEWEYRATGRDRRGSMESRNRVSHDDARVLRGRGYTIYRRRPEVPAGPWEVCDE